MGKLVRDGIPDIIRAEGGNTDIIVLDEPSYRQALLAKLIEEAAEAQSASPDALIDELADVWEVLQATSTAHGFTMQAVVEAADRKQQERGGFNERLWLET